MIVGLRPIPDKPRVEKRLKERVLHSVEGVVLYHVSLELPTNIAELQHHFPPAVPDILVNLRSILIRDRDFY